MAAALSGGCVRFPGRAAPLSRGAAPCLPAGTREAGSTDAADLPPLRGDCACEYLSEDQAVAIAENFQAKRGAEVKADVFRLSYLLGIRKGQLRRTKKRHVLISGDTLKRRWSAEETKNGKPLEVLLVGEARAIVERAWANRLPDCEFLFHDKGKPLGPMHSELQRTCELLSIPYGRGKGVVWHDTAHRLGEVRKGDLNPHSVATTGS